MRDSALRALVVFAHYPERLSYFADWLDALVAEPTLDVTPANLVTPLGRRRVRHLAPDADLVVCCTRRSETRSPRSAAAKPRSPGGGKMAAFIGNEVSLPGRPLRAKVDLLRRLQPDVIGTQLLVDAATILYADVPGTKVVAMPHAEPANFHPTTPNNERSIDVGFRGGRYPASLGENDRDRIVEYFATTTFEPPLATDVRIDASYGRRGGRAS